MLHLNKDFRMRSHAKQGWVRAVRGVPFLANQLNLVLSSGSAEQRAAKGAVGLMVCSSFTTVPSKANRTVQPLP